MNQLTCNVRFLSQIVSATYNITELHRMLLARTGIPQNTDHHWLLFKASVLVVDDVL